MTYFGYKHQSYTMTVHTCCVVQLQLWYSLEASFTRVFPRKSLSTLILLHTDIAYYDYSVIVQTSVFSNYNPLLLLRHYWKIIIHYIIYSKMLPNLQKYKLDVKLYLAFIILWLFLKLIIKVVRLILITSMFKSL